MYALLRTRCGCEKIMRVDRQAPEYIDLPMSEPVKNGMLSMEEVPLPMCLTRRFVLTRFSNGMLVYLEQLPQVSLQKGAEG